MRRRSRRTQWCHVGTGWDIIFATNAPATGLQRVPAAGGEPTVLTKPDPERGERDHLWPEFLPGGAAVLFTIVPATGGIDNAILGGFHQDASPERSNLPANGARNDCA